MLHFERPILAATPPNWVWRGDTMTLCDDTNTGRSVLDCPVPAYLSTAFPARHPLPTGLGEFTIKSEKCCRVASIQMTGD